MTGSKRKSTSKKTEDAAVKPLEGEMAASRVVAIPKEPSNTPPAKPAAPATKPKLERIGDILRQARLDRGDDLYQIAEYLCIKPSFLIALENSRYDEFPADAYVIGFLRTYANFLGVDGKDAVDRYRYEMAGRRKKPILAMPVPVSEGRAPSGIILVGAAIAALLIYALWYGISSSNRTQIATPPPLPTAAVQPATPVASDTSPAAAGLTAPVGSSAPVTGIPPEAPGIMLTSAAPAAKSEDNLTASSSATAPPSPAKESVSEKVTKDADKKVADTDAKKDVLSKDTVKGQVYGDPNAVSRVIIQASQSSWVSVADENGKVIFDHVLKPGDTYKVPSKPGLTLTTGNGAGITLTLDGNEMPKVATGSPHVVRNISLDPDRLTDTSSQ